MRCLPRGRRLLGTIGKTGAQCRHLRAGRRPGDKQGPVERQVQRIVTPGTLTDDALLETKSDSATAALYFTEHQTGLALLNLS